MIKYTDWLKLNVDRKLATTDTVMFVNSRHSTEQKYFALSYFLNRIKQYPLETNRKIERNFSSWK